MADMSNKITELENEIKVIKNEVKAILLDIREQYLNAENPFIARAQGVDNGPFVNIGNMTKPTDSQKNQEESSDFSALMKDDSADSPVGESGDAQENKGQRKDSAPQVESNNTEGTLPLLTLEPDADEVQHKQGKKTKASSGFDFEPAANKRGAELLEDINDCDIKDLLDDEERPVARSRTGRGYNRKINLITIAGLSRWVDESTEKIGKERTEVMVEACHMVGHISTELKDLVIRLVRLSQVDVPKKGKINTRDYLGVIAQLDNLLGYNNDSEAALYSILTNVKETNSG
jgi:hypothetical protein